MPMPMPMPITASRLRAFDARRSRRSWRAWFFDTIILAGGNVYWANGGRVLSGVPSGTNNSMTVVNSAEIGNVTGFAIGTANVYFGEDGFVEKGPLPGGAVAAGGDGVKLARGQKAPTSFVLAAAKVYWANDCAILSAAQELLLTLRAKLFGLGSQDSNLPFL